MTVQPINSNAAPQKLKLGYGDYLRFRNLVLERSGLYFPEKKMRDLEAGLLKALAESSVAPVNGHYNLDHYYNLLCQKSNPTGQTEMERLINTLTVGETYFFRNEAQFDALSKQVLPALIARKRAAAAAIGSNIQPQLRIWSAGCASGEEPYSLAILLKELLPDISNWYIFILATDINQKSLARAREAHYSEWSFREARAKILRPRYFSQDSTAKRYRLQDDIRQMVTFASLNLIEDDYPAIHNNTVSMDLILCRNVTIYFAEADTVQVIGRFYKSLSNGGWLVVGHSEPSLVVYRAFQARTFPNALFYQKTGQATPWPDDWAWLDSANGNASHARNLNPQQVLVQHPQSKLMKPPREAESVSSSKDMAPRVGPFLAPNKTNGTNKTASPCPNNGMSIPKSSKQSDSVLPSPEIDPYEVAGVLLDKGRIAEAIDELHRKLAIAPNFAPAHSLLGRAYANQGHWAEARRWCESALKLDNLLAEAYYVLALIHDHEDETQLAIAMLKKAIYLEREAPLFHFNLAMLYRKTGQVKQAQRACRTVIRILEKWPPAGIVPDTGGATAQHLLETVRRILSQLRHERQESKW